jgi:hypothetical protein
MNNLSQCGRLLKELKKHKIWGITNHFIANRLHILRYSARIGDLRNEGYNIYAERQYFRGKATGTWKYYLIEEK